MYRDSVQLMQVSQELRESDRPWKHYMRSPRSLDGRTTQSMMIFVDDVDAHCAHAKKSGAKIATPLATNDYGAAWASLK